MFARFTKFVFALANVSLSTCFDFFFSFETFKGNTKKLDPVGLTVRYEMMKLFTGSVKDSDSSW